MRAYSQYIGLALGVLAAAPCAVVAVAAAGGGHGSYFPARLLFPFSMLSTLLSYSITAPFILVALLQFPTYGFVLGYCHKMACFKRGLLALTAVHVIAVMLTLVFPNSNFPNRFGFTNKRSALDSRMDLCLHIETHRPGANESEHWTI